MSGVTGWLDRLGVELAAAAHRGQAEKDPEEKEILGSRESHQGTFRMIVDSSSRTAKSRMKAGSSMTGPSSS